MGWFSSTPAKPPTAPEIKFTPDLSSATIAASEVTKQLAAAQTAANVAAANAAAAAKKAGGAWFWPVILFFGVVVAIMAGMLIYDAVAPCNWPNLLMPNSTVKCPGNQPVASNILYITSATYGGQDVSTYLKSLIKNDITLPSFLVSYSNLGLSTDPDPKQLKTLDVQWYVGQNAEQSTSATQGTPFPTLPTAGSGYSSTNTPTTSAAPPPFFSKLWNSFTGGSSGNLAPSFHDATTSATISGNQAPLSAERDGGYGMQWWMYVKDWNYGYGKDKPILVRPDSTNSSVMNPKITLHPTDNSMRISVSIFPSTEGGSGKAQPAPAGHSGSSDDVFVCEVPNIPLQSWFSVSVTVFGRNLDVYIDGKLVKSCFLGGVPKPAVGDIQLTPGGGFSGRICNFYHYPRMLTPADAMTFWSAGTSCRSETPSGGANATGYSVKFGLYDALGKEVQEYAF